MLPKIQTDRGYLCLSWPRWAFAVQRVHPIGAALARIEERHPIDNRPTKGHMWALNLFPWPIIQRVEI